VANRYQLIADDLRRLLQTGAWTPGERLPSELELASRYGVSTPTLRNALEVLQSEGLVEKRHGAGNFVRQPRERLRYCVGEAGTGETSANGPIDVTVEAASVKADARLSALLDMPIGAALAEYVFTCRCAGAPWSVARVYVPRAVARLGALTDAGSPWGDAVRALLSAAGVDIVATTERITARFPTAEEAGVLQITTRTPVLAVERNSRDAPSNARYWYSRGTAPKCCSEVVPSMRGRRPSDDRAP
jgi:GntR family transcriptional regulator